jgi:hypothetical protein
VVPLMEAAAEIAFQICKSALIFWEARAATRLRCRRPACRLRSSRGGSYLTDVAAIAITAIHPTMISAIIAPRVILAFSLKVVGLCIFDSKKRAAPDQAALLFAAPAAQQENPARSAPGSGLLLHVGKVDAVALHDKSLWLFR